MTTLIAELRRRGHQVRLDGLRVVLFLREGADVAKAERWAREREQELRAELVAEASATVGLARSAFHGGRVREVRGPDGEPVRGQVEVSGGEC